MNNQLVDLTRYSSKSDWFLNYEKKIFVSISQFNIFGLREGLMPEKCSVD
jgi:hypothetical protein